MVTRVILAILVVVALLVAQTGTPVRMNDSPSAEAVTFVPVLSGSQVIAQCYALSTVTTGMRAITRVSISAGTNANPVVFTSTGHGFQTWMRPSVTIAGATGNWSPVNGTFVATVIDANTFSIPVDSTTFSTLSGTLTFSTTAPRSGQPEWAVQKYLYDGSGNNIGRAWINGSTNYDSKCSDVTSTTVQLQ